MLGNRAELGGAAVVTAVAAFFLYFSFQIQEPMTGDPLGPRWLPIVLSSFILVLGLMQCWIALREPADAHDQLIAHAPTGHAGLGMVIIASLLTLAYAGTLELLGYALATVLFAIIAYFVCGRRSLPMAIFSGAAMAACFYLLFVFGLQTALPTGTIFGGL